MQHNLKHNVTVTNRAIRVVGDPTIVRDNINVDRLTAKFDSEWEGLDGISVFFINGDTVIRQQYSDGMPIPWEVLTEVGTVFLTFKGYHGDNEIIVTKQMKSGFIVEMSGISDGGEEPSEASPTEVQQIYNDIHGIREDIEAGMLKGDKGDDGYTPVKGVDYFDGEPGYTPQKGIDYFDGEPGYTPVKGVDYFDGEPGEPGEPGVPGEPGHTPAITATKEGNETTLFADGVAIAQVLDGADGDDYVLTDEDRGAIAAIATEELSQRIDSKAEASALEAIRKQVQRNTSRIEVAEAVLSEGEFGWKLENQESYEHTVPANAVKVVGTTHSFADLVGIEGKSVVWNQLVNVGNKADNTSHGITFTNNRDNSFTLNGVNDGAGNSSFQTTPAANHPKFTGGHKYAGIAISSGYTIPVRINITGEGSSSAIEDGGLVIYSAITDTVGYVQFYIRTGDTRIFNGEKVYPVLLDLTQMFGAGNEPTDLTDPRVEWIMRRAELHPEYNTGEIVSAEVERVESWGKNLWDEQWEYGDMTTAGVNINSTTRFRSKNYIPIIGGETYSLVVDGVDELSFRARFYDANKNFISVADKNGKDVRKSVKYGYYTFVAPDNAAFMRFSPNISEYGTPYNNNIAIVRGNGGASETYSPYGMKGSIDLPALNLKEAGSAADRADFVAEQVERKVVKLRGKDLAWSRNTMTDEFTRVVCTPSTLVESSDGKDLDVKVTSDKFFGTSYAGTTSGMKIGTCFTYTNNRLFCNIPAVLDTAAKVAAWMNENDPVFYVKLAEPTIEPLNVPRSFMEAEPNGTIRFAQASDTMPVPNAIRFPVNNREALTNG